jgi:hypothetical protein
VEIVEPEEVATDDAVIAPAAASLPEAGKAGG